MLFRSVPASTCSSEKECEVKWSAARRWIHDNCGFKLQHYSGDFMETFNATDYSPSLACRVSKEPVSQSTYQLRFEANCANMFGCNPPVQQARNDFNRYVTGAWAIMPE